MRPSTLESRLDAVRASGRFAPAVIEQLAEFLTGAPDEALFRISPLRYARDRALEEREAIELFLHATRAGLLDFDWGVLCPGCAGFIIAPPALRQLQERQWCSFCRWPVQLELDSNVEVAFTVSPACRQVEAQGALGEGLETYFSTSIPDDASSFHRAFFQGQLWSARIARDQDWEGEVELPPGHCVLLAPAIHAAQHITAAAGSGGASLEVDLLADRVVPGEARISAGRVALRVRNRTGRAMVVGLFVDPIPPLEQREPGHEVPCIQLRPYLTGKRLITSQAFIDLFQAASIPSEGGIAIKALTLLFTDLAGSTALYEQIGDLSAYDLVRRHFESLLEIVSRRGGAVVKTIGDAVMASFTEPAPAMRAAIEMQRAIPGIDARRGLALKIGLHAGPCVAVDLNDRLDYFGQTVNLAARVQSLANPEEIVCTEEIWSAPQVSEAARGLPVQPDSARLKGIAAPVPVVRIGTGSAR